MSPHAMTEVDDDMVALRNHVSAPVALPGERVYERAMPWNVAVPVQPAAVVLASTASDVAEVMRFANDRGLRVAVQATGHGAVPIGADTVLVLTAGLTGCVVDPVARAARVGAGVKWQTVLDAAAPHGLAPLCGSAPGVGVVGYLSGGGIGPLVRSFGLSADHVRAFEMVTGAGQVLRVTPDEHADLFWGLRGGKSMLGIVTAVEIDLLPSPNSTAAQSTSTVPRSPTCCAGGSVGAPIFRRASTPPSASSSCPCCRVSPSRWPAG